MRCYKVAAKDRGLTYREALNERAWSFFRAQAPWYQRTSIFWVMEAKRFVKLLRAVARLA